MLRHNETLHWQLAGVWYIGMARLLSYDTLFLVAKYKFASTGHRITSSINVITLRLVAQGYR